MDYRQNRYYLRYDGRLNSSSLFKVIKTCPSSAYVCKVLIALGTYEGNWCFSRFFLFLTNCRKFFFFSIFFFEICLHTEHSRSTKEFLRTSLNVSVGFRSNWNLEVLVNMKRGKPEYPEKKLLEQRKEPTTNSTHIWCRRRIRTQATLVGGKCSHRCATKLRSYNM